MTDRIEELLGSLGAEDEEEQEEVLALPVTEETVPFSPHRDEGEAGDSGKSSGGTAEKREAVVSSGLRSEWSESGEAPEGRTAFAQSESLGRVANRRSVTTGEITSEQPDLMARELWKVGPAWTVRGGTMSPALEGVGRSGAARAGLEQAGLKGLYRQTVQGLRPAAPVLLPEQVGRTARAQEPGSAASLAVDELDRAVRRDSRRYDGGMSIY